MATLTPDHDLLEQRIQALVRRALSREVVDTEPIEPGLGTRRFFRVRLSGTEEPTSVIARVESDEDPALRPKGVLPEPPLGPIREWLDEHGVPVFALYGSEPGLDLLEDLGGESLEFVARTRPLDAVHELYRNACALVPTLQRVPTNESIPNFDRRLDASLFDYKAEQFISWALPLAHAEKSGPSAKARGDVVREAFAFVARESAAAPQRLAHRDYKAANLHVTGDRLVMIDLQGAFLAPPEYDLVCLLRDSHVELDETFVQSTLQKTRPAMPDAPDLETFRRRFTLLTLTRNSKDLARFLYTAKSRGDSRYIALLPRAVATLKAASALARDWDPSLARLADVMASLPDSPCAP